MGHILRHTRDSGEKKLKVLDRQESENMKQIALDRDVERCRHEEISRG